MVLHKAEHKIVSFINLTDEDARRISRYYNMKHILIDNTAAKNILIILFILACILGFLIASMLGAMNLETLLLGTAFGLLVICIFYNKLVLYLINLLVGIADLQSKYIIADSLEYSLSINTNSHNISKELRDLLDEKVVIVFSRDEGYSLSGNYKIYNV